MFMPNHVLLHLVAAWVLAFCGLQVTPQAGGGGWAIVGDSIPAGEVIDNDVILTGTNVVLDGTVNGDAVAVGTSVTVNGTVTGSLVVVGRTVSVGGSVEGSAYIASTSLQVGPSAAVKRNLHFGGFLLDSQTGSVIGRDLVAASIRAQVSSEIGRALNAIILLLQFNGKIGYPLEQDAGSSGTGSLVGSALSPSGAGSMDGSGTLLFVGAGGRKIMGYAAPLRELLIPPLSQNQDDEPGSGGSILPAWLVARMGELAALLLIGALAVWLIPSRLKGWTDQLRAKPLPAAGFGLLALAVFANGLVIALVLGALILVTGLWLGSVALWELAFLFWGIGYSCLILAFSIFALAVFYGSKVIVAYLVGGLILGRFAPGLRNTGSCNCCWVWPCISYCAPSQLWAG
jgi:cytoskeletal protein CcmA (bactofilin family)